MRRSQTASQAESESSPPDFRDHLTIFLVSGAVMLYQIGLTRVLSVVVWYHFAFLVISMVMLGLGVPGVWFALVRNPLRYLSGLLLAAGILVPLSVALIVQYGAMLLAVNVLWIVLFVLPATLALGGAICVLLIKSEGRSIGRMYGADLFGAGLAAVLVIPLMNIVPTPSLAAGAGALPLFCLLLGRGVMRLVSIACLLVLTTVAIQGDAFRVTASKEYDERRTPPLYESWSPIARITVFDDSFSALSNQPSAFSWGRGTRAPRGHELRQYWLEQDGSAGTPITEFDGDLSRVEHLLYDVTTLSYQLRPPKSVAIIGAGGGRDILSALLAGASHIDAIELNGQTIDVVSTHFAELSGDVYHVPGVHAVVSEGRSFLTHSDRRYDLIQISLIDSWAASTAGAFALAENNLYTVEAFELYLDRLADDGIISTSRWMQELPRLIVLADAALRAAGVEQPKRHILIVNASEVATLLTSKRAFDRRDLAAVDAICLERGFVRLYPVASGASAPNPFIAETVERGLGSLADLGLNVSAPTDDSPYFFHVLSPFSDSDDIDGEWAKVTGLGLNLGSSIVLRQLMFGVISIAVILFLLPFAARVRSTERSQTFLHLLRATIYFALIGFAFMLVENVLVQRFVLYLGHPSYAATVILASLLLGMGAGSSVADRFGVQRLQRFGLAIPILLVAIFMGLPAIFGATMGFALSIRILISTLVLLPLGAALGVFFPLGMLRFGDDAKPWYWAINGVFSVVASVLSLALSMDFGFTAVGLLSALGYLAAWTCVLGKR